MRSDTQDAVNSEQRSSDQGSRDSHAKPSSTVERRREERDVVLVELLVVGVLLPLVRNLHSTSVSLPVVVEGVLAVDEVDLVG